MVVGEDDEKTAAVARRAEDWYSDLVRVVVDDGYPKNKPRALNRALPYCRGEVVGIFDTEDSVHPELLRRVDALFKETNAAIVQGGVQLVDYWSSWYAVRNCLEYYFWFRSGCTSMRTPDLFRLAVTLSSSGRSCSSAGSGTPTAWLRTVIWVFASALGARVSRWRMRRGLPLARRPTDAVGAFFRQRTRWNQGFLQVYRKGDWRRLPDLRQRLLARYTLRDAFPAGVYRCVDSSERRRAWWCSRFGSAWRSFSFVPLVVTFVTLAVKLVVLLLRPPPIVWRARSQTQRPAPSWRSALPDHPRWGCRPSGLARVARPPELGKDCPCGFTSRALAPAGGRTMRIGRYTAVSVISILTTQVLLQIFARSGMGAERANALAVVLAAIPAFELNRSWTWRDRRGETSIRRQVVGPSGRLFSWGWWRRPWLSPQPHAQPMMRLRSASRALPRSEHSGWGGSTCSTGSRSAMRKPSVGRGAGSTRVARALSCLGRCSSSSASFTPGGCTAIRRDSTTKGRMSRRHGP